MISMQLEIIVKIDNNLNIKFELNDKKTVRMNDSNPLSR